MISVVIIGIAFSSLIGVFSLVAKNSRNSEEITMLSFLAQGKMEEYLARGLGNIPSEWISFANTSESYQVPTGHKDINYPGRFPQFYYRVILNVVSKEVEPVISKEAGSINDLKRLTVDVIRVKGSSVFSRSISTLLPSVLQE